MHRTRCQHACRLASGVAKYKADACSPSLASSYWQGFIVQDSLILLKIGRQARKMSDRSWDRQVGKVMPDQAEDMMNKMQERGPTFARKALGLITLLTAGTTLLVVGGLTLAGTVIGGLILLAIATPVLIFFSPVLIPIGITLALGTAALVATGAFLLAVCAAVSWLYKYFKGRRPPGADQLEFARHRAQDAGSRAKDRIQE
ncbi:hypothetical protein O6H91_10G084200 [Diphasiastrum complanatum]|uniref:Uncharacterized protein n=1 Tax=Diphasiastrum complanatum TaxID=34168 RepID=A0ACC2CJW1_DIPCM|nr:hypothetical protein O6H91_10G084200 [Diphasiastrum complanatum]